MTKPLPRIRLTARRRGVGQPNPLVESIALQATYSDAVERAGGLPVLLAPRRIDKAEAARIVASLDAVVSTGGTDVDPALYGQSPHPTVTHVDRLQDDFEMALLEAALNVEIPLLCICRGMQLLNVVRGGTLAQHILDDPGIGEHGIPFGGGGTIHQVNVDAGTRLAEVLDTTAPMVECHHHQAVDRVGNGLSVIARAVDGTVEALEVDGREAWTVAVQWHPEDTAGNDPHQQRVFDELVRVAGGVA
ncbi:MAG: gamma-glutamyl-gamma-aminobutyrate hydrolase family protein [Microthrixaceae bacterium]